MRRSAPNILFIMYDQLRFDYLSCAGHKTLETPNFDRVAARGVRFDRAYCQSPVCGSSRMSTYTGRYVSSHGAAFNNFPLKVGEHTMGDHLRAAGMDCWLIGKTHMKADAAGMERLGLAPDSVIGTRIGECGFDVWIRDDGLWAEGPKGFYDQKRSPYNEYLKSKGYTDHNPWHDHANAGIDDGGDIASGFLMMHADKPANVREEDSETPWLTDRTIDFIDAQKADQPPNKPWCAHVSYIKPHWPYIVPAPYHNMYAKDDIQPVVRSQSERDTAHPIYDAYLAGKLSGAFSRDEVRETVIPAYMGLIKQCDDHLGRLLDHLDATGQSDNTVIVLTSDHGDYMGDHWMGEKDFFHDPSVRVPLIIADPRPIADATRGTVSQALVEQIDLAATFVEMAGGEVADHILEGRSLLPLLRGDTVDWREFAISEYDFSTSGKATQLGLAPRNCRLFMVVTERWKLIHAEGGFRPMLFDLEGDPQELTDLGNSEEHSDIIDELYAHLHQWSRRMAQRTTVSDAQILARRKGGSAQVGVLIGVYGDEEIPDEHLTAYRGKATPIEGR
ncbi:sulfatase-like hydrolase/transferase [Aliiroseovarius lamellibrachiae]|uniref:sulfatase-like hydrolase/transferase n=1 Tax=Aliiroseovarius lamellibrachiae TaxID=1924933 RepID=UPI001BDF8917|nr:sulfatase-like hydrolase/transferase [Aliiroseovarius lamellibrachiae]MBT2129555.1 sulfatase-like hydrolase/transferase [Aliiroseovarius lamellibrachiae]